MKPDNQVIEFSSSLPQDAAGVALIDYLGQRFDYLSRLQWGENIANACVLLDGKRASAQQELKAGQQLVYLLDYQTQLAREADVDTAWHIVWQNADLLVVHKPAGMPVSRTGEIVINNLINLVRSHGLWPQAQLLNRLDRETSGLLVLAKDLSAAKYWQPRLTQLLPEKHYLALVYGQPSWSDYDDSCRLGKSLDAKQAFFKGIRCQMQVQHYPAGKYCRAKFHHLAFVSHLPMAASLIQIDLLTGRQHQIRAQLKRLGHSIIGDKIYAHQGYYYLKRLSKPLQAKDFAELIYPNHCLFAWRIKLNINGQQQQIVDPYLADFVPAYLHQLLKR